MDMLLEKIAKENDIKKIRKEDYKAPAEEIQPGRGGTDHGAASEPGIAG